MSDSLNNSQMSKNSKKSKQSTNKKINESSDNNNNNISSENNVPIQSVRAYLEETVTAAVQEGMMELVKKKPENPLEFLGNFLIEKSKKKN
jgi:hypothetical protein